MRHVSRKRKHSDGVFDRLNTSTPSIAWLNNEWYIVQRVSQRTWQALVISQDSGSECRANKPDILKHFTKDSIGFILSYDGKTHYRKDLMCIMLTGMVPESDNECKDPVTLDYTDMVAGDKLIEHNFV